MYLYMYISLKCTHIFTYIYTYKLTMTGSMPFPMHATMYESRMSNVDAGFGAKTNTACITRKSLGFRISSRVWMQV